MSLFRRLKSGLQLIGQVCTLVVVGILWFGLALFQHAPTQIIETTVEEVAETTDRRAVPKG